MKTWIMNILLVSIIAAGCSKKDSKTVYTVDGESSYIEWKGSSAKTFNTGTFSVTSSEGILIRKNKVAGGSFKIPVSSLVVTNLQDPLKQMLTDHLKSVDFFNLAVHPTLSFTIKSVEEKNIAAENGVVPGANSLVKGELTMLGVTKPVTFPAKIMVNNKDLEAEAILKINRLEWGMTYDSDPELGDGYIFPLVDLHIKLFGEAESL